MFWQKQIFCVVIEEEQGNYEKLESEIFYDLDRAGILSVWIKSCGLRANLVAYRNYGFPESFNDKQSADAAASYAFRAFCRDVD